MHLKREIKGRVLPKLIVLAPLANSTLQTTNLKLIKFNFLLMTHQTAVLEVMDFEAGIFGLEVVIMIGF